MVQNSCSNRSYRLVREQVRWGIVYVEVSHWL